MVLAADAALCGGLAWRCDEPGTQDDHIHTIDTSSVRGPTCHRLAPLVQKTTVGNPRSRSRTRDLSTQRAATSDLALDPTFCLVVWNDSLRGDERDDLRGVGPGIYPTCRVCLGTLNGYGATLGGEVQLYSPVS